MYSVTGNTPGAGGAPAPLGKFLDSHGRIVLRVFRYYNIYYYQVLSAAQPQVKLLILNSLNAEFDISVRLVGVV